LKESNKLVFAVAVCEKKGKKDRKIASTHEEFFGDLFCDAGSGLCVAGEVRQRPNTFKRHIFIRLNAILLN